METIFIQNDNILELQGLKNAVTDADMDSATVTVTVTNKSTGAEVAGETWPLTMTAIGSGGVYRATLIDILSLVDRMDYIATIEADGGAGLKGKWEFDFSARIRRR